MLGTADTPFLLILLAGKARICSFGSQRLYGYTGRNSYEFSGTSRKAITIATTKPKLATDGDKRILGENLAADVLHT